MLYMVLSAFSFAVMAAFARLAGQQLPAQEVVFFRSLVSSAITVFMIWRAGAPLFGTRPRLLALRGVTGFLSLSCYFWSVLHMPFAEAVLLAQTNPIFTALLGWVFLRERPGARFLPAALLVFAGVLVTVPPGSAPLATDVWVGVSLAGALFAGSAYTEVRALSRSEHPLTIVFWFQFISVLLSLPGMAIEGAAVPHGIGWGYIVGVGVAGQAGQLLLTHGLRRAAAWRATLANPLVVAFGAVLGWLLFAEPLGWNVLGGGALLVAGLLLAAFDRTRPVIAGTEGPPAP